MYFFSPKLPTKPCSCRAAALAERKLSHVETAAGLWPRGGWQTLLSGMWPDVIHFCVSDCWGDVDISAFYWVRRSAVKMFHRLKISPWFCSHSWSVCRRVSALITLVLTVARCLWRSYLGLNHFNHFLSWRHIHIMHRSRTPRLHLGTSDRTLGCNQQIPHLNCELIQKMKQHDDISGSVY